ncbi:MAG: Trm112 family protein [Gemmatimonadota bacterium]
MHILLTDFLTCPRCGPEFGLILLADQLRDRRIDAGELGCANCRNAYPIRRGAADLRVPGSAPLPATDAFGSDPERVFRAAALLGVTRPNTTVLVVEAGGTAVRGIAEILSEVHVVGASARADGEEDSAGVISAVLTGERIPLRDHSVAAVALLGSWSPTLAVEAARVLSGGGRLVVDPAPAGAAEALRETGFDIQLEQEGVVVAAAPGPA